jgi:hypothetical protein
VNSSAYFNGEKGRAPCSKPKKKKKKEEISGGCSIPHPLWFLYFLLWINTANMKLMS